MRTRPDPDERRVGARDLTDWRTSPGRGLSRLITRVATVLAGWTGWRRDIIGMTLIAALGGLAVLVLADLAEDVYEDVAEHDGVAAFDLPVLREAIAWRTPMRDDVVTAFTDLGGTIGMPIIALVSVALMTWRWRSRTPALLLLIAAAGSLLMTTVGKSLVGRARPDHALAVPPFEDSPSFPSGHTLNATVVVGILAYLLLPHLASRAVRIAAVFGAAAFAGAMGLSRVFLGHHWLTDVMAGWALGLLWVVVVVTAHRIYLTLQAPAARPASSRATGTRKGEHDT